MTLWPKPPPTISLDEPAIMALAYHVTGERRKELVKAISQITGMAATYRNAPTFAFAIGNYLTSYIQISVVVSSPSGVHWYSRATPWPW